MTDDPKPLNADEVDAFVWAAASVAARVRNPGDAHEDHAPPKISTTLPRYMTEADKLRERSPEASVFYNVLRDKGLLYPQPAYSDATKKILSMSPLEFAAAIDHSDAMRVKQQREEWERRAALLTPDQVCHNVAHACTLLAAAWLCECPQPHKAVEKAGMWEELDPDPAARAMRIARAQNVERQMQEKPNAGLDPAHAEHVAYERAYKREPQGEWITPEPVETTRTTDEHERWREFRKWAAFGDPRRSSKLDQVAEIARRLAPHITGHSMHTRVIDEPVVKESDPKLRAELRSIAAEEALRKLRDP